MQNIRTGALGLMIGLLFVFLCAQIISCDAALGLAADYPEPQADAGDTGTDDLGDTGTDDPGDTDNSDAGKHSGSDAGKNGN